MRVYVAGPMTGIPHFNFPAFISMADLLRSEGFDVVSPAELDDPEDRERAMASPDGSPIHYESGKTWGDFLARDVKLLSDGGFDAVIVLPGWERSKGARLETYVANALHGLPVYRYDATYRELNRVSALDLVRAWASKQDISFHTEVLV